MWKCQVTPGPRMLTQLGKSEIRPWIWKKRQMLKQMYLFREAGDHQQSGRSQGTTAQEALRSFPGHGGHSSGAGLSLIILVSHPCISFGASCWAVTLALEEKPWQYEVSFQDVQCSIVGINKLQDGSKNKQKEAEQVITSLNKKMTVISMWDCN